MFKRVSPPLTLIFACLWAGCSVSPLSDLTGYACESDGGCAEGYTCDEATDICVATGDSCDQEGRESPCTPGASDCTGAGCRTCVDGAWSDCEVVDCTPETEIPCNGEDEDCDGSDGVETGTDTNCAACGDSCGAGNGVATASCDSSGASPACVVDTCDAGLTDTDGLYTTGCEGTCVPNNGGVETCDDDDNDCNGLVDDITDEDADCNGQVASANVADWSCLAGTCSVVSCEPDFWDIDADGTTGCEYACALSNGGVETCDGADNDCNDVIDDVADATADCGAIHTGATDVTGFSCTGGACAVSGCTPGMEDDNDDPADGCEAVCVQSNGGVEACDDDDNDCNGIVDDAADGATGCTDYYLDTDADGFGLTSDTRCICNDDGFYTATVDGDCDDTSDLCTTDCADSDGDTIPDCRDDCVDLDADGLGDGAYPTDGCDAATPDSNDSDPNACADTDADGCDDCAVARFDPSADGTDSDFDGICDLGDACTDADGDGIGNGDLGNTDCVDPVTDSNDADPNVCADVDLDTCEDCLNGTWDTMNDGADSDSDGICDAAPPCIDDADGDGLGDGSNGNIGCSWPENDLNDSDPTTCIDSDNDGCDDCSVLSTFSPSNDGPDSDGDTICDVGDVCAGSDDTADLDGDTVPDGCDACPGNEIVGTDCGTCAACDGTGTCLDDLTQNGDCNVCQQCAAGGTCVDQIAGDDANNDCAADACNTGVCDGSGACGFEAIATDCGQCQACDGAGTCVDDLAQDVDCPVCQECGAGGACVNQGSGDDIKSDCTADACNAGTCDGLGSCSFVLIGTDCGQCQACDGAGTCGDDLAQDTDCALCEECGAGGTCVDQGIGSDVNNDCAQDACNTGTCDGGGACGFEAVATDCGQCQACDGGGTCIDDLTQDADCPLCQSCGAGGSCADQTAGDDDKNDCAQDACNTGNCDGSGACGFEGNGTDCGQCQACDGSGVCIDDLTQDVDCGACEECGAGGSCANQGDGGDIKNDCDNTLFCDGDEVCNGTGGCRDDADPCSGFCDEGGDTCDCSIDADCPACERCNSGTGQCVPQNIGSDTKNDCPAGACVTGTCDGAGACGMQAGGFDCGQCSACDGLGACLDDLTQDGDCPSCEECGAGGSCVDQALGSDVKGDCGVAACRTGDCNGGGGCEFIPAGTDCGTCRNCNAAGNCNVDDLTQDGDCGFCEECGAAGTCADQGTSADVKNECPAGACVTGDCNGGGACGNEPNGLDCGQCQECNGSGACIDDLTQNTDCGFCEQCVAGGNCADQPPGNDVKNQCTADACNTGDCNGGGACGFQPATTDCGTCSECNATGGCIDDLAQDTDCGFCRECIAGGACDFQTAGDDVKNQCTASDCDTGDCDGAGACDFVAATTACTDDGVYCNGPEECDGAGTCAGTGDPCPGTDCNNCNEGNGDCFDNIGSACIDDGTFCNGVEQCDGAGTCTPQGDPCPGTECNTCNEGAGTCFTPVTTACTDDGLFCTGAEECDGAGTCSGVGNACLGTECNTCDEAGDDCTTPVGTACTDDGAYCTGAEECDGAGACASVGNPCLPESECNFCDEAGNDCFDDIGTGCTDNGLACDGTEECDGAGTCASVGSAADGTGCDEGLGNDGNVCNSSCQSGTCTGLVNANNGEPCPDDSLFCTGAEACNGIGACAGSGDPCAAGTECNDSCNELGGDCFTSSGTGCTDDGVLCNGAEECNGTGTCAGAGGVTDGTACDEGAGSDGNECNSSCQASTCSAGSDATNGEACDDGIACTAPPAGDTCDGAGSCLGAENDPYCAINYGLGYQCEPVCTADASGCVNPPASMTIDSCTDDPTDLSTTAVSACQLTLTGADVTDQAACISCEAEIGITVLDTLGFDDDGFGGCLLGNWTLDTGAGCYPTGGCPRSGALENCCDTLSCPIDNDPFSGLNGTFAMQTDRENCTNGNRGMWHLFNTNALDTTGLVDVEICFDWADHNATFDELVQIEFFDGTTYYPQHWCQGSGPIVGANSLWTRNCIDLGANAEDVAALTVHLFVNSDDNDAKNFLDNIEIRGWGGGCAAPVKTTVFTDNFASCDPFNEGWTDAGPATPLCGNARECDGTNALYIQNNEFRIERTVDASALDGDIEICFDVSDDGATNNEDITVEFNAGSGWEPAWTFIGNPGTNRTCFSTCASVSNVNPAANRNPNLGIAFVVDSNGGNDWLALDNVSVRGVQYCLADGSDVALSAPSGGGGGVYSFNATDAAGTQLLTDILCESTLDTTVNASYPSLDFIP